MAGTFTVSATVTEAGAVGSAGHGASLALPGPAAAGAPAVPSLRKHLTTEALAAEPGARFVPRGPGGFAPLWALPETRITP